MADFLLGYYNAASTFQPGPFSVAGVPGKVRRTLTEADRELILKYARNYLDYTAIYLAENGLPSAP